MNNSLAVKFLKELLISSDCRLPDIVIKEHSITKCGRANIQQLPGLAARIVGGTETLPHAYPWMALITGNGSLLCGGSVINDRYILTAAHCLSGKFLPGEMKVTLAEHNRCRPNTVISTLSIERFIRHPNFNPQDFTADIMLLRLSMRITFDTNIRPICLPPYAQQPVDQRLSGHLGNVLGWGRTSSISPPSCWLQQVMVPILPPQLCTQRRLARQEAPARLRGLFCAGLPSTGKDACTGDSGGPLQLVDIFQRTFIIGIVSNGIGCAVAPGLYTDVSLYIPWIISNTRDSSYCRG